MESYPWILAAVGSAFFAGLTSILAKLGLKETDSDVATAVRTGVVLVFAWFMTFVTGSVTSITSIDGRSLLFLLLSGAATGASWLCYFRALSLGDVNKVTPVDKSSSVLSVLFAIILLGETTNLALKLICCALILAGTFLMIEKRAVPEPVEEPRAKKTRTWLFYAVLSAVFAALVAILSKIGFANVDSNLGTAIRTCVVLIMAWGIVFGKGKAPQVKQINKRELAFICASGLATGASWLCYFYAIQTGVVSIVVPIDKLSILVTIAFAYFTLGERLTKKSALGLALLVAGTLLMLLTA